MAGLEPATYGYEGGLSIGTDEHRRDSTTSPPIVASEPTRTDAADRDRATASRADFPDAILLALLRAPGCVARNAGSRHLAPRAHRRPRGARLRSLV